MRRRGLFLISKRKEAESRRAKIDLPNSRFQPQLLLAFLSPFSLFFLSPFLSLSRLLYLSLFRSRMPARVTKRELFFACFFSSRLADVALRLGPYMSISSQKDICTRTQEVHQSWQIKINQKNTRPTTTTTRKSPSQICVSSRENSKPDKKTGQGPNKKTTTTKICQRTQRIYHRATPQKPAK